jgi:thioredoxin-like negative regulator of GroEL
MFFCKLPHVAECKVTYAKHPKFINRVRLSSIASHREALTRSKVIDADPSNNDAKMKLAELYEIMDEPRKALELVYQGTLFSPNHNLQRVIAPHSY